MVVGEQAALVRLSTEDLRPVPLRGNASALAECYVAALDAPYLRAPLERLMCTSSAIPDLDAIAFAAHRGPSRASVLSIYAVADFDGLRPETSGGRALREALSCAQLGFETALRGSDCNLATPFWYFRTRGAPPQVWSRKLREELHEDPTDDPSPLEPFLLAIVTISE